MNTDSIFSPITINSLAIKNRLVMSSMVTQYAAGNGEVTDQMLNYYADRARGGVGLIMVEATYVERQGNSYRLGLGIDSDAMLPGLTRLTRAVHACGGKIGIQLQHGGRTANPQTNGGPVKLVSYIPGITPYEGARVLTCDEIHALADVYAGAALRAREAGFDLIELHGAHGYLLNQFLSPFTNRRQDEYGGSEENRLRFPLEVLKACRNAVGADFPVTVRLSVDEFNGTGLALEQSLPIARAFADNGIDALNISVGACETNRYTIRRPACPKASTPTAPPPCAGPWTPAFPWPSRDASMMSHWPKPFWRKARPTSSSWAVRSLPIPAFRSKAGRETSLPSRPACPATRAA